MELTKEQEILQKVLSEAWTNPSFKQELIASPQAAVKRLTGETFTLPAGKTLEVYDQSKSDVLYLNIPEAPDMDNVELTDKELEMVAGGKMPPRVIKGCLAKPMNQWPASCWPMATIKSSALLH